MSMDADAPTGTLPPDIREWLTTWTSLITAQHFDEACRLFSTDVRSFGTVAVAVQGREELVRQQWQAVWPCTRNFRFLLESAQVWEARGHCSVAVQWVSEGLDASTLQPYARAGRATLVLQHGADGWQAVHSHFSVNPARERFLPSP